MSYYGGKEIASSFRTVRNNTIQIAEDIPESKYSFKPAPDVRSVAQLLVHIGLGPTFQLTIHRDRIDSLTKVNFPELMAKVTAEEAKPRTKAEIIEFLKTEGEQFASFVEALSDAFLSERVAMPPQAQPPTKTRFEMLLSPKEHEMHHRGQLMLIERMIGIVPHLTRQNQHRMAAQQAQQAQR